MAIIYRESNTDWQRPTFEEEYTGEKEDQAFEELEKKLEREKMTRPKQYSRGIDTFERMRQNMSIEGIMATTVCTVDAYIWRDKGSDYEDFKKARDWLDFCIKEMEKNK